MAKPVFGFLRLFCLFCVGVVVIGILTHIFDDPVPEGIEPAWKIKLVTGASKIAHFLSWLLSHCGIHELVALRFLTDNAIQLVSADAQHVPVQAVDHIFKGVPVRIFKPEAHHNRGVVFLHGGGWFMGSSDAYANKMKDLASRLHTVVVSVDYRLSPEHVYPAAIDDCEKATVYFLQHSDQFGVDSDRVAIMGASAGGALVASVVIRLQHLYVPQPKLQVLMYPITQVIDFDTPSYRANAMGPVLTTRIMALSTANYIYGYNYNKYIQDFLSNNHTTEAVRNTYRKTIMNINLLPKDELLVNYEPKIQHGNQILWDDIKDKVLDSSFSPLFEKNLTKVPPAYVSTCQYDPLRDDGIFYVKRLEDAGVKVTHQHLMHCVHGCMAPYKDIPTFSKQYQELVTFVDDNL